MFFCRLDLSIKNVIEQCISIAVIWYSCELVRVVAPNRRVKLVCKKSKPSAYEWFVVLYGQILAQHSYRSSGAIAISSSGLGMPVSDSLYRVDIRIAEPPS